MTGDGSHFFFFFLSKRGEKIHNARERKDSCYRNIHGQVRRDGIQEHKYKGELWTVHPRRKRDGRR